MTLRAADHTKILVHGHRGARARLPENTIPGFEYAIRLGVDALEMDLSVTRDDAIVISHDPVLHAPMCTAPDGMPVTSVVIRDLTLEQVRQWDCGAVPNPRYPEQRAVPGTRMPTLDEVFGLAGLGNFDYNLEAKCFPEKPEYTPPPEEFAGLVLAKIRRHRMEKRTIFQSFDFRILRAMKQLAPEIRLSALTEDDRRDFRQIAGDAQADGVSPHYRLVTRAKAEAAHQAGLPVIAWTANTAAVWERLIHAGVEAIISDDPEALIAYLKTRDLR